MITDPGTSTSAAGARRRARLTLAGLAVTAVLVTVVAGVLTLPALHHAPTDPPEQTQREPAAPAGGVGDGWDWAGEAALAARPMPVLPVEAARPQTLSTHPASSGLRLPPATGDIATVAAGFPQTPAGAVAALAALTTQGLRGGDPRVYADAYRALSARGAPPPAAARLTDLLTSLRSSAGLPPAGPVPDLRMAWRPMAAQVKGVLDDGRYAVVCVLGQFTADYQGRVVTIGVGDCQAMRWTGPGGEPEQWRISPGPAAARAADAWPGSQDAVAAGYQEIR